MNRERFEELAKLKGMGVTIAERRFEFVTIGGGVIEIGEYMSRITEAAWWGWQEAMKEVGK